MSVESDLFVLDVFASDFELSFFFDSGSVGSSLAFGLSFSSGALYLNSTPSAGVAGGLELALSLAQPARLAITTVHTNVSLDMAGSSSRRAGAASPKDQVFTSRWGRIATKTASARLRPILYVRSVNR